MSDCGKQPKLAEVVPHQCQKTFTTKKNNNSSSSKSNDSCSEQWQQLQLNKARYPCPALRWHVGNAVQLLCCCHCYCCCCYCCAAVLWEADKEAAAIAQLDSHSLYFFLHTPSASFSTSSCAWFYVVHLLLSLLLLMLLLMWLLLLLLLMAIWQAARKTKLNKNNHGLQRAFVVNWKIFFLYATAAAGGETAAAANVA